MTTHASAPEPSRLVEDVRRFVRRRVEDPSTQDDLVQEVLLRVYGRADQLRDDERIAGWVRRIAFNVVTDHYRRRPPADPLPPEMVAPPPEEDPSGRAMLAAWVAATVSLLPEHHREVLTLTELQGLTQREAAARLGLSVPAVKARVRRGRAALLERLERCCDVELDHRGVLVDYAPRSPCAAKACCPADGDGDA